MDKDDYDALDKRLHGGALKLKILVIVTLTIAIGIVGILVKMA